MEILLGKTLVLGLALLVIKYKWDVRMLENKLYIAEHVFFKDSSQAEDYLKSDKPKSAKGRKR